MIQIEDKLISAEVVEELFHCDIIACKGACCVEGDLGAPLEIAELDILDSIYEKVKPYLRPEGIAAIEAQGKSVLDFTHSYSTPLVNEKECAYVTFDEKGIANCGIEQAWSAGDIAFRKPVSCHLYPIRIREYRDVEVLNYDRWDICSAACSLGVKKGIPVYEFVKDALIRKYGEEFYETLDSIVKEKMLMEQQDWEDEDNDED
ncbi:MAG: DUF3109 family protein [Bacteroidia bacterium]|nr:DUF3109 family protein [Bacteroidia bacterium]